MSIESKSDFSFCVMIEVFSFFWFQTLSASYRVGILLFSSLMLPLLLEVPALLVPSSQATMITEDTMWEYNCSLECKEVLVTVIIVLMHVYCVGENNVRMGVYMYS